MDSPTPISEPRGPAFEDCWAFFLDIDGTLVKIAQRPDRVVVDPHLLRTLTILVRVTAGATAIVSGRTIVDIDRLLAPLKLPAAGQHGAEWRARTGHAGQDSAHREALNTIRPRLNDFAARHDDLFLEDKGNSLSLHYRGAAHKRAEAERLLQDTLATLGNGFTLHHGKQVLELRPAHCNKGRAIERFMAEPPFAGRRPVFIGDDTTDEDGFKVVNRLDGHTIKVGPGATAANWWLADTEEVLNWLDRYARRTHGR